MAKQAFDKQKRLAAIEQIIQQGPFSDSWDSLEHYQVPDWYQDAKFGIFIHWGVYSVPAFGNEWYPRNMYRQGSPEYEHHRQTYGPHDQFGYKDFIPMFTAETFDPAQWADLFKRAGAKYVMPVAEHHDGFQMYDSELSGWNAAQMGPKKDIMQLLGQAVRDEGMVFCASSHRAEHWWFMGEGRNFASDVQDPDYADFYGPAHGRIGPEHGWDNYLANPPDQEYLEDWLMRTCEIIDRYHPQVLWFDWWIMNLAFKPWLKKLAAYYYNQAEKWGVGVAINYKYDAFPIPAAVFDVERGQLSGTRSLLWQTDTAVQKNSWGYTDNQSYKTAVDIIGDLIDIVSKNGVLLLNIGPRADGSIPQPEQDILLEIGDWLSRNGEAIYGTRAWCIYGEGPTKVAEGAFTDTSRQPYTPADIRFTSKGGAVYALLLACPEQGQAVIKSLGRQSVPLESGRQGQDIHNVVLAADNTELAFIQSDDCLTIDLPQHFNTDQPFALRISWQI